MLDKIKEFFQREFQTEGDEKLSEEKRRLACAALMIEIAIIDNEFEDSELDTLRRLLKERFNIPYENCDELIALAHIECDEASSMYQFTQLINTHCNLQEKYELLEGMWQIAYADGNLDKYEEYMIRKVSDLIHLSHSDYIRAKHSARP